MGRRVWARSAAALTVVAASAIAGMGAAQADPPPGWEPGQYGVEYDLADIGWTHPGHYAGVPGNWHTGWINVEEDDDGVTGTLLDWRCPAGVEPPGPYAPSGEPTRCTLKGSRWLEYIQYYDVATIDQARDRMTVNLDVPVYVDGFEPDGTVRVDLVIKGLGDPEITSDESGEVLDYTEVFDTVRARGKVDGHRVRGPNTTQEDGRMGFWLDGWTRSA